jgi:hypothetical protein
MGLAITLFQIAIALRAMRLIVKKTVVDSVERSGGHSGFRGCAHFLSSGFNHGQSLRDKAAG